MNTSRILLISLALAALASQPLCATEVYRWTDENGVVHFSQTPPPPSESEVSKLALDNTQPADYDPEADIYGVAEQQERMKAWREEREKKRQERLARQPQPARQAVNQDRERDYFNDPVWGYPGTYPTPPNRPRPPIQRPPAQPGDPIRPPSPITPPRPLRPN
jgi:hypothetical protein